MRSIIFSLLISMGFLLGVAQAGTLREPQRTAVPKPTASLPAKPQPPVPLVMPVVVIDAGHGGVDPGAIGPDGTQEKDITLSTARALRDALRATGRVRVILTRDADVFLKLSERVQVAQRSRAALFISLHADTVGSASDPALTRGASIYTISDKASDEVSARLAARENKADLLGGKASAAKGSVSNILLDLLSQETMKRSKTLAESILDGFEARQIPMLERTHRSAGFAVLKGETFPSVLIEMGFISSEQDSELLRDRTHQQNLAAAIAQGVEDFLSWDSISKP